MNRFATAALSLLVMGAMASPTLAQRTDLGDPLGSLYLSAAPDSYVPVKQLMLPFVTHQIYMVVDIDFADIGQPTQNSSNGITGWEASITAPSSMIIVGADFIQSVNLGEDAKDFIVGTGEVISAADMPKPLVTFDVVLTSEIPNPGFLMEIGPASTQSIPGESIWLEHLTVNGCLNVLTGAPVACLYPWAFTGGITIGSGIAVEEGTWGSLKRSF